MLVEPNPPSVLALYGIQTMYLDGAPLQSGKTLDKIVTLWQIVLELFIWIINYGKI